MRMARVNVTISDQLLKHARGAGLNISKLTAAALCDELNRRSKLAQLDAYLAELEAELGPVDPVAMAEAARWADGVFGPEIGVDESRRSA